MKARDDFKIGDAIRWTPDPLAVPFGPALEAPIDPCPRLCGVVLDLDDLGQPFRVSVTAVEGDWTISPLGWRPKVGDIVVAWSVDRAGTMERLVEKGLPDDAAELGVEVEGAYECVMTSIEASVRQCTIYVGEVYDATGNTVVAMRAVAMTDDKEVCSTVSEGRLLSSGDLELLLAALGGKMAVAVAAKEDGQ